jgi:2-dehydro-3-deoxy-D-arabinonate dehydratase
LGDLALDDSTTIEMRILRDGHLVFDGEVDLGRMKRRPQELVTYLYRECSFPVGCLLMTGTGLIPPKDFSLEAQDEVRITIEPLGTLVNRVSRRQS